MSLKERAKAYFAKQPKLTKEEKLLMNKNAFQRLEHIKKVYEEMSNEEFKERLIDAGFEIIEDGKGKIYFEEEEPCQHEHKP